VSLFSVPFSLSDILFLQSVSIFSIHSPALPSLSLPFSLCYFSFSCGSRGQWHILFDGCLRFPCSVTPFSRKMMSRQSTIDFCFFATLLLPLEFAWIFFESGKSLLRFLSHFRVILAGSSHYFTYMCYMYIIMLYMCVCILYIYVYVCTLRITRARVVCIYIYIYIYFHHLVDCLVWLANVITKSTHSTWSYFYDRGTALANLVPRSRWEICAKHRFGEVPSSRINRFSMIFDSRFLEKWDCLWLNLNHIITFTVDIGFKFVEGFKRKPRKIFMYGILYTQTTIII